MSGPEKLSERQTLFGNIKRKSWGDLSIETLMVGKFKK